MYYHHLFVIPPWASLLKKKKKQGKKQESLHRTYIPINTISIYTNQYNINIYRSNSVNSSDSS